MEVIRVPKGSKSAHRAHRRSQQLKAVEHLKVVEPILKRTQLDPVMRVNKLTGEVAYYG